MRQAIMPGRDRGWRARVVRLQGWVQVLAALIQARRWTSPGIALVRGPAVTGLPVNPTSSWRGNHACQAGSEVGSAGDLLGCEGEDTR